MELQPLHPDEAGEAGAVLARAFADDPLWGYLFGPRRERIIRIACAGIVRDCARHGRVDTVRDGGGRIAGVAAWLPPGAFPLGPWRELAGLPAWLRIVALRPRSAPAAVRSVVALDRAHPPEPHWFLSLLGVEPSWQGRGAGSRLLAPVLEQAELAHLDTSKPENLSWYRRFGFEVERELRVAPGAPPSWALRYEPADGG
jgi:GNAT superfamily N-acetyltransferase